MSAPQPQPGDFAVVSVGGPVGVELFADGRWPGYVTPADLAGVLTADFGRGAA